MIQNFLAGNIVALLGPWTKIIICHSWEKLIFSKVTLGHENYFFPLVVFPKIHSNADFNSLFFSFAFYVYVMLCAIWYRLYTIKNVRKTHEGVLVLVKLSLKVSFIKGITPPWVLFTFFIFYKWYLIGENVSYVALIEQLVLVGWYRKTDTPLLFYRDVGFFCF